MEPPRTSSGQSIGCKPGFDLLSSTKLPLGAIGRLAREAALLERGLKSDSYLDTLLNSV